MNEVRPVFTGESVYPAQRRRRQMRTTSPKIELIVSIIILFTVAFCCHTATADDAPRINTDKDIYNEGETIRMDFFNAPGSPRDWVCVVPAGSPDTEAGDYQYMPNGLSQGSLPFNTPPPGKYEVRAYYNYSRNGYVVSARHSFSVADRSTSTNAITGAEKIKPPEGPAVTALPSGSPRFAVAVFHFTPLSVDVSNYGIIVTSTLINAPKMQSSFALLGKKDMEIFLTANNLQQDDRMENIIEIGTRLGLNFVIAGSIGKKGTMIVTNCKVVSIDLRKVVFTDQSASRGESDLIRNIMKMSDAVIKAMLSSTNI
jgi:TolB-like protein